MTYKTPENIAVIYKRIIKSLGAVLDQTQTRKIKKTSGPQLEKFNKLHKEIENIFGNFSQVYGITVTLSKKYSLDDPLQMHRFIQRKINRSRLWKARKYILIPEFSEINSNLHYHGLIYDCYELEAVRLSKWWKREFGFTKLEKEIRHPEKWSTYILKDINTTGLWPLYRKK